MIATTEIKVGIYQALITYSSHLLDLIQMQILLFMSILIKSWRYSAVPR